MGMSNCSARTCVCAAGSRAALHCSHVSVPHPGWVIQPWRTAWERRAVGSLGRDAASVIAAVAAAFAEHLRGVELPKLAARRLRGCGRARGRSPPGDRVCLPPSADAPIPEAAGPCAPVCRKRARTPFCRRCRRGDARPRAVAQAPRRCPPRRQVGSGTCT
eukprot:gene13193-biopygen4389